MCLQIFPHHENEIAQSQACACEHDKQQMDNNGTDFVRFWLHNGFVNGILPWTLSCLCQWCTVMNPVTFSNPETSLCSQKRPSCDGKPKLRNAWGQ